MDAKLSRDLAFVVPAPYESAIGPEIRVMTVDVDLSDSPTTLIRSIVLKKTITGPRGRKLVVAAEAKSKGAYTEHRYHRAGSRQQAQQDATAHWRFVLSADAFSQEDGDLALVLICRVVPPYLTETKDHTDPEQRGAHRYRHAHGNMAHANVGDIWLINPREGHRAGQGTALGEISAGKFTLNRMVLLTVPIFSSSTARLQADHEAGQSLASSAHEVPGESFSKRSSAHFTGAGLGSDPSACINGASR